MIESFWVCLTDIIHSIDWRKIFPKSQAIHIDLGAGDGGFAVALAQKNPQWNVLAVERLKGRATKIEREARRLNLSNLRILRLESCYFITYLVPPLSVAAIHVMHPDPWPKRKQQKNRLFQKSFVEHCAKVLVSGGSLRFTSDHPNYFSEVLKVVGNVSQFQMQNWNSTLNYPKSDFEKQFIGEDKIVMQQIWKKN